MGKNLLTVEHIISFKDILLEKGGKYCLVRVTHLGGIFNPLNTTVHVNIMLLLCHCQQISTIYICARRRCIINIELEATCYKLTTIFTLSIKTGKQGRSRSDAAECVICQLSRLFATHPGPICSKLTMLLVIVSLKFLSSNMAYLLIFLLKKNMSSFCTHIFSAKIPGN